MLTNNLTYVLQLCSYTYICICADCKKRLDNISADDNTLRKNRI